MTSEMLGGIGYTRGFYRITDGLSGVDCISIFRGIYIEYYEWRFYPTMLL